MEQKSQGKIIGLGFQKTGTSSLIEALKILGYKGKDDSTKALIPILCGNFPRVVAMLKNYDAVVDTPWYMIYKELDHYLPGSKFILTYREEEGWYNSVARHIGLLRNPSHEWIYGRGKGLPMDDRENTLKIYRKHLHEVRAYFKDRPDDFLEVDFTRGDGWDKLCPFLGRDIPDAPFPHANKWEAKSSRQSYYGEKKDFRFFRKQFRHAIKIWYIDRRGLW